MMKKRKSPIPNNDDDDDSAMELVDAGEEKVEAGDGESDSEEEEEDDDDDDDMDEPEERNPEDNSFMDTFYGLSSSHATERAKAANAMLNHCLLGPDANTKDAAYALRRLLNGLCSGRAASRQGNASALASFLKISLEGGQLGEIRSSQETSTSSSDESILEYVRQRLLKATDSSQTQGKKKSSEERDYHFGRLFGILGIVRSGILLPNEDSDADQVMEVATAFVSDLVALYWHKNWMREPAAHAIGTILNTYYALASDGVTDAKRIVQHLVVELVIPKLLQGESGSSALEDYSAEQIAVAATIQSQTNDHHPDGLPAPLDKPIITTETIPVIAKALLETSSVTQPRMHLVWDAMWLFLTEPIAAGQKKSGPPRLDIRKVRDEPLVGGDSTRDITESLLRHVVVEGLLQVDAGAGTVGKTTHEKRALALSVVRNLLGVPFNSSITGPTKLQLEAEDIETILTPLIIRRLFLDVICAGGGKKKAHTLKPLVLQSLELMVDSMSEDASEAGMNRRIATAQYIVRCEPKFDTLTKTTTIADLVGLGHATVAEFGANQSKAIQKYFDFLERQIASSGEAGLKPAEVSAYIDLLYLSAKRLVRLETGKAESEASQELEEFRPKTIERTLGFLMASSFFDCSAVSPEKAPKAKSKKGKGKGKVAKHAVVDAAVRFNQRNKAQLPYDARTLLSERFYSLLAEFINSSLHSGARSVIKDAAMLDIVANICNGWKMLEAAGAKPLFPAIDAGGGDDDDSESPDKIVSQLQGLAKDLTSSTMDSEDVAMNARKRCAVGCAALASTLFLHLLGCGKPEDIMDEDGVTTEQDDDSADIIEAIEEIGELTPALIASAADSEQNPLAAFAEVCMGLFSSGMSSGSPGRGASPTLLREAIKFAWIGALSASANADRNLLDSDVVSVLVNGIGAGENEMDGDEGGEEEEDEEEEGDDSDEDMDDDEGDFGDFSKVGNILGADDDDDESDKEDKTSKPQSAENQEDQDVEINSDRLNSLLEDDSDAEIDVGELEHHEGADAALAMLIKMRQDSRKSSRKARERLELEKQLRCTLLIETLLGKSESWADLLRSDVILQMVLPLLAYRNKIEKSLSNISGKAGNADASTKKAMLERVTSILKTKLFKLKFAGMPTTESVDLAEYCRSLASSVLEMARKKISKDQRACCSVGLPTIVKALVGSEGALKVASVYVSAVDEWSTKGTSRLEASLFEEFVHRCPSVARATLLPPLAAAATVGRTLFFKQEAFHLMSLLLNPNLHSGTSAEFDEQTTKRTKESLDDVSASICTGLKGAAVQRYKRIREVLKAAEQLLAFANTHSFPLSNIGELAEVISEAGSKHESKEVKKICKKMNGLIEELKKQGSSQEETSKVDEDEEMEEEDNQGESSGDKKDKKKKKKKKKKGKK